MTIKSNIYNLELLEGIFKLFKIIPKNYSYYLQALTHPSYSHDHNLHYDYERFEFIGDAAISWIICNFLFSQKELDEGSMSIKKSRLVSGKVLTEAAKKIKLDQLVLVGKGIRVIPDSILENVFEAFVGAVARDLGIKKAALVVEYCIIKPYLQGEIQTDKPFKTLIQEALMRSYNKDIKYVLLNKHINPNSHEELVVNLVFDNKIYGTGKGFTQREAEEAAAKDAYSKLIN